MKLNTAVMRRIVVARRGFDNAFLTCVSTVLRAVRATLSMACEQKIRSLVRTGLLWLEQVYLLEIGGWEIANDIWRRECEMIRAYQRHDKVF